MNDGSGILAALISSTLWAWASVRFSCLVPRYGPFVLGLFKAWVAATLFWITMAILGESLPSKEASWALMASGVLGMGLGDVAYLAALGACGVRVTTLIHATHPLLILAYGLLGGSTLGTRSIIAIFLITLGVIDVLRRRSGQDLERPHFNRGVILACISAACQASGVILSKPAMDETQPVTAAALRLTAAGVFIALTMAVRSPHRLKLAFTRNVAKDAVAPSVIGTYLGIIAMMMAIKALPPAVAGALLGLTPIPAIPFSTIMLKEPLNPNVIPGTLMVVIGVALL